MSIDITVDDFMTGVIAACKAKGYRSISMRDDGFYRGMKASFDELQRQAGDRDLDVRFWVFLDQFHHDSPVISEAVRSAVVRNLVSLDNPEFVNMRIKVDVPTAEQLLEKLPGGASLHRQLADVFLAAASAPASGAAEELV